MYLVWKIKKSRPLRLFCVYIDIYIYTELMVKAKWEQKKKLIVHVYNLLYYLIKGTKCKLPA